jgi:hypothetical protein
VLKFVLKKPKPGGRRLKKPRPALETKSKGALFFDICWVFSKVTQKVEKTTWKIVLLRTVVLDGLQDERSRWEQLMKRVLYASQMCSKDHSLIFCSSSEELHCQILCAAASRKELSEERSPLSEKNSYEKGFV